MLYRDDDEDRDEEQEDWIVQQFIKFLEKGLQDALTIAMQNMFGDWK